LDDYLKSEEGEKEKLKDLNDTEKELIFKDLD